MPVVASLQIALNIDAPEQNTHNVIRAIRYASEENAELVVLPELSNSGYCFNSEDEARSLSTPASGQFLRQIIQTSEETKTVVVVGFNQYFEGDLYSSSAIIDNGRLLGIYKKSHLWGAEKLFFKTGSEPPLVVETSVGPIGTAVCYDIEFPETVRMAAELGAVLLAVPVNWPRNPRLEGLNFPLETAKAIAAASQYRIPIAIADRTGTERGQEWEGASTIVHATGALTGLRRPIEKDPEVSLVMADLEFVVSRQLNPHNCVLSDRRSDIYTQFDKDR